MEGPFVIGRTISHYRILEQLGGGGMGVIYKAEDTKLKRTVALKFLPPEMTRDPEAKERFIREAQAASSLQHNNICTIHDIDETDEGQTFIVMDLYEGETLKERIQENPPDLPQAVDLFKQIAEGLASAHAKGIVQRDIKPANIVVTAGGVAKILDFGLAKLSGEVGVTKTGTTVGTVAYMAPEQAQGEEVDARSDLFSLGAVAYELLTGQRPFKGEHDPALLYSIVNQPARPMREVKPEIPESLDRVVGKMLEKKQEDRYQGAADVVTELEELKHHLRTGSAPIPVQEQKSWPKLPILAAVVVLLLALLSVAYHLFFSPADGDERRSIAVLPFENLSPEKENEYFSDGMTEDIIAALSKVEGLKVISRTSVMQYKNVSKPARAIGEELDVVTILEGSVRRQSDRVRIVAQLIDTRTDEHIWTNTYDRDLEDIFEVQSDVARSIATALKAELTPDDQRLLQKKSTENLSAYDVYLKGRDYYRRYTEADNASAIRLFKRALQLDTAYALAFAGLGDAYAQSVGKFGYEVIYLDSAEEASRNGLAVDPECAEAHKALGLTFWYRGKIRESLREYEESVRINPNYDPAVGNIGWVYIFLGKPERALPWMRRNVSLSPTLAISWQGLGDGYRSLEEYAQAIESYERALELQPGFQWAHRGLIGALMDQGRLEEARGHAEKLLETSPDTYSAVGWVGDIALFEGDQEKAELHYRRLEGMSTPIDFYGVTNLPPAIHLAHICMSTDRRSEAEELLKEEARLALSALAEGDERYRIPYTMAAISAIRGNQAETLQWLQKSIESGWRKHSIVQQDPIFAEFVGGSKFDALMQEVKQMVQESRRLAKEK
jgi:non-specific serine/threonine protein kinase